jgi:hypothetical protein
LQSKSLLGLGGGGGVRRATEIIIIAFTRTIDQMWYPLTAYCEHAVEIIIRSKRLLLRSSRFQLQDLSE